MGQGKETKWGSGFTCKERNKLAGHLLQKIRSVAVEKNPPMGYPFLQTEFQRERENVRERKTRSFRNGGRDLQQKKCTPFYRNEEMADFAEKQLELFSVKRIQAKEYL